MHRVNARRKSAVSNNHVNHRATKRLHISSLNIRILFIRFCHVVEEVIQDHACWTYAVPHFMHQILAVSIWKVRLDCPKTC